MPRTVQELLQSLDARGMLPSEYSVGPPFRDNTLCLVEEGDCWRIFFYKRGQEENRGEFPVFSEASQAFLDILARGTG